MDRAALGRKMAKIVILGGVLDPPKRVKNGHFGGGMGVYTGGGIFRLKTSKLTILRKTIKIPPPHDKILSQGV